MSGTRINKFASAHDFPKFVKVGAAMEHELRKVGTEPEWVAKPDAFRARQGAFRANFFNR
jgi:hypothetical protein